jgi:CRP/FNR family transcriptional regulator, cyclic AMP receptor protein
LSVSIRHRPSVQPAVDTDDFDFLSLLSASNRRRILEGSTQAVYSAGASIAHPGGAQPVFLIERGLARAYWSVPDGRQTTVAILRQHELVGGAAVAGNPPWSFVQAITESTLTILDRQNVCALAEEEAEVAMAIATQLSRRISDACQLVAIRSLGNIRARIAYDLLDRAGQSQAVIGRLEVTATQAQLADSIGSSREVLSRALAELRAAGTVETAPGIIRILKPQQLAAIVSAFVI